MNKILLSIIALVIFINYGFSQTFSLSYDKFIKEFSPNLNNSGEFRENAKSISKEFTDFWELGNMSLDEKDQFIKTANLMQSKGCKAYPDFVCLADNVMLFKNNSIDNNQYKNYELALTDLLNSGKRPNLKDISEYLVAMNIFLSKNIIVRNQRTHWKVDNNSFQIKYDKGLVVEFENVDLIGYQNVDSLKIYKTNARYNYYTKEWNGSGGIVGWERVGYDLETIHAKLQKYTIDMKNISYVADSVLLINNLYFKEQLLGKISDKTANSDKVSESNYPRFTSYLQQFKVKDIVPGMDYEGGFSIHGKNYIGSGTKDKLAHISIRKNDSIYFSATSSAFYLDSKSIFSNVCAITIHFSEDSIYHPHLNFKYDNEKRFLELVRTKEDYSRILYTNSYHHIAMDFTWLKWFIDTEKIEFATISNQNYDKEAGFESLNYYTLEKYRQMRKRDPQHPLEVVTEFIASWSGVTEFYLEDLSNYMGYGKNQVLQLILNLAYQGYLYYDMETEFIKVYPNAWEFIEAHRGTKDSDIIQFYSKISGDTPNAELSLLNFDLKINGIETVHISDLQNVKIYTDVNKRQIILKKNLSFLFDGYIQAGQFHYYGSNFKFDYNRFLIELTNCDSMKMVAETEILDEKGNYRPAIVRNKLEHVNGEFYIDDPQNKSGRRMFPEYPKFNSASTSYVYYDRHDVQNKAYKRDNFYFEVEPFFLDSLKGYARENLRFKGTLHSGGIFPPIDETLVLRNNDFSLGFNTHTGPSGLSLYEGKATYWNEIDLSNHGLRGVGKIEYITSTFDADYLLFLPEQMKGHAENFAMKKRAGEVEFPTASGRDNTLNWYVNRDQFSIIKESDEFKMFDNKATINGNLSLASSGLSGNGAVYIENARITSELFKYKKEEINADTSKFSLYTQSILDLDFEANNVNTHINFDDRNGKFKTNGDLTTWVFPKNKYMSQMSDMTWHMDKKELESNASLDVLAGLRQINAMEEPEYWESMFGQGPKFTSTHFAQDSLFFYSPRVVFDYEKLILKADDVKFIRVADAAIYPDSKEKITIERDAVIHPLSNAIIVADTINRYHNIFNSSVNISGKKKYTAKGEYNFLNGIKTIQKINFDTIYVDAIGQTRASGKIEESYNFTLSPKFAFQGDINLMAQQEHLEFNGGTKIIHQCENYNAAWLKFRSIIDPENIYIPIDSIPYDIKGNRVSAGMLLSHNYQNMYPAFVGNKTTMQDQEIFFSSGVLYYDMESNDFIINSKEKINNPDTTGNFLRLNDFYCNVEGSGQFLLSRDFGLLKPNAIGRFEYYPGNDTISFYLAMLMEAHFSKDAQKIMANKLNSTPGLNGISFTEETYEKAIFEYLGEKTAQKWFEHISRFELNKIPNQLTDKFVFTDLEFTWDAKTNSFIHYGPIGIANIGKEHINKYVYGFIKIEKRRGDVLEILLEPDSETWFYFKYQMDRNRSGVFRSVSSDEQYNIEIYNANEKQRTINEGGYIYQYGVGSSNDVKKFRTDMYRKFNVNE
jgi:hypothetical protein